MDVTCATCSADNPESARFCRKCGTPLGDAAFTEAPTRSLEGNPDTAQPARALNTFGSSPFGNEAARYAPPVHSPESAALHGFGQVPVVQPPTPPVAKSGSTGARWLLIVGAFLLLAILGGAATVAVIARKIRAAHSKPPIVSIPDPPAPPSTGGRTKTGKSDGPFDPARLPENLKPWYYEGAEGAPVIQQNGSTAMLIMKTDDSASDVADYYRDKFAEMKSTPNQIDSGTDVVLTSTGLNPGVNVIISENGDHDASDDNDGDDDDDDNDNNKLTDIVITLGGPSIPIPSIPHFGREAPVAPPAPPSDKALPKPPDVPKVQR